MTRLLSHDDLKARGIRYSKVHLWRLEKQNKFPKRVPIGSGRYGYVEAEIDESIEACIEARDRKAWVAA